MSQQSLAQSNQSKGSMKNYEDDSEVFSVKQFSSNAQMSHEKRDSNL